MMQPPENTGLTIEKLATTFAEMKNVASDYEFRKIIGHFRDTAAGAGFALDEVEKKAQELGLLKK